MIQRSHGLGFTLKPVQTVLVTSELGRKHFESDPAIQFVVLGQIDVSHPARTDLLEYAVM